MDVDFGLLSDVNFRFCPAMLIWDLNDIGSVWAAEHAAFLTLWLYWNVVNFSTQHAGFVFVLMQFGFKPLLWREYCTLNLRSLRYVRKVHSLSITARTCTRLCCNGFDCIAISNILRMYSIGNLLSSFTIP